MKLYKTIPTLAIIALLFSSCGNSSANKISEATEEHHEETEGMALLGKVQRDALDLKMGKIEDRNMNTAVKTNGQLEVSPNDKADITSFIGGNVKTINVFHGDKVNKGKVLATLEHPDYIRLQEEFSQVSNRITYLEKEYNRQKELFENEVGSGKNFQKVQADYLTAKTEYKALKMRLEMVNLNPKEVESGKLFNSISIKAPISGYVNDINIKIGAFVNAETKIFSITNNKAIHADFLVYEKDVHSLNIGQKVSFNLANQPNKEYTATIFSIGKEFQADVRAIKVHAKIDNPSDNFIIDSYISGYIHTNSLTTKAVPESAIVSDGGKSYIFVLDKKATEAAEHESDEHGHDHGQEAKTSEHKDDEHEEDNHSDEKWAFRMVEVITGTIDNNYVEISLVEPLESDAKVVLNCAYYILSDLKKSEAEHTH